MKNIRAYIIITSCVKKLTKAIFTFISISSVSSHRNRNERLSPSYLRYSLRTTFTPSFLFLHFSRKVTPGKVGELQVSLETRSCNCILRLWAFSARTYGKSSQLALITLEWSTINSRNLPLNLGHGYRVLRNRAMAQLHFTWLMT